MRYYTDVQLRRDQIPPEAWDQYPLAIPAIQQLERLPLDENVTFLIGENGSGKSTLIEAIAIRLGFNAEGGSRNFNFATRPSHSDLHQYLRLPKIAYPKDGYFLRAESFYNLATEMENLGLGSSLAPALTNSFSGNSLHEQSHGESFFALLCNRLRGHGIYLFDEPESALSPARQLAMLTLIHRLVKQNSQIIIATHSPILMAYPQATIYQLDPSGIQAIAYQETDHYRVTHDFLANPKRSIQTLLEEDPDLFPNPHW